MLLHSPICENQCQKNLYFFQIFDNAVKSLCLTQSHEATKGKSNKIQNLFFVIFVASCENLIFYGFIKDA